MTLGQHIQELRKAAGLSQEALGEALGVSRQAISKWESDGAVPEVDKLIAMSRLFGISIGKLLQVEAENEDEPVTEELTDREWRAVEAVAKRYAQELSKSRPAGMKRWQKICLVLAAVILIWVGGDAVESTRRSINTLENRVSQIDNTLSQRMNSMSDEIQRLLEQEASLLADWSCDITNYDVKNGYFWLRVDVTPKQYVPGMTVTLSAELPDGDSLTCAAQAGSGTGFRADPFILPLVDGIKLSVILDDGTQKQTQVLETFPDIVSASLIRTWASFNGSAGTEKVDDRLSFRWQGTLDINIEQVAPDVVQNSVQTLSVQLYKDSAKVSEIPVALDQPTVESKGGYLSVTQDVDLAVPIDDFTGTLALVVRVADSYDRISYFLVQSFSIDTSSSDRPQIDMLEMAVENYIP